MQFNLTELGDLGRSRGADGRRPTAKESSEIMTLQAV